MPTSRGQPCSFCRPCRRPCPQALIEALALGTPVVATDCKNGPREVLQDGKYGLLVPVGVPAALAEAMSAALASGRREIPLEALRPYTMDYAVGEYCRLIGELTHEFDDIAV